MVEQQPLRANHYVAAAGHYLAAEAAQTLLEAGGNAVDAGVAANLVLGVVQSDQVNVAGVAPILIYRAATDDVVSIAGLGPWPAATDFDRFEAAGGIPLGIERTVVPAAPDANLRALERFGTRSFAEVAAPAIRLARDGFPMHALMAFYLDKYQDNYRLWPENHRIYLPGDRVPAVGDRFVQSDLAASLQYMADEEAAASAGGREAGLRAARNAFYAGDIGRAIVEFHRENGGLLTEADLAAYESPIVAAESRTFHAFGEPLEVVTCGAWCQGPTLLQMLSILETVDLRGMGHNSAAYIHHVAEAIKLAFADRERHFGDPAVVDVPLERLLDPGYNRERRGLIDPGSAWPELPPAGDGAVAAAATAEGPVGAPRDTSYVCVIDREGNAFSCNPSDVTWDSPVVPGTGLCPSSRGSQSWAVRGHASSAAPGKRPRLTPNPVLLRRRGEFVMPIGTPGGDVQPQAVLQVMLNRFLFGMDEQAAIDAPRFVTHSQPDSFAPHEAHPGRMTIESRVDQGTMQTLEGLGHRVEPLAESTHAVGGVCAAVRDQRTGQLTAGADPRRPSGVRGW